MTDQFSSQLSQWLSRYHAFVGTGRIMPDPLSGRSLGPASGTIWEIFPFQTPCAFTGLFAGLSVAGFDPSIKNVRILEYRSRRGFHPVADGPFSGNGWQNMTGEDWSKLNPIDYMPIENLPLPAHQTDLLFALDEDKCSTADPAWTYRQRELSMRYVLHSWSHPDGLVLMAACFTSYAETSRPFLRPCFATDPGAAIDPACLYPHRRMAQLFSGLTVLTAGENIRLNTAEQTDSIDDRESLASDSNDETVSPNTTVITVTKKQSTRSAAVRAISGVTGGTESNLSFAAAGAYKITRQYSEIDTETGFVSLIPNALYLLSRDEPCCNCDDYVADYERVRELFAEQEKMIGRYNELYAKIKDQRDKLQTIAEKRAKLIRLRIEKTELRDREIRCQFTLIYTNVRQEEYEHRPVVIGLVSKYGMLSVQSAKVIQQPRDTEFDILGFGNETIEVSSLLSPPLTHLAVRLEVKLIGPILGDFDFEIVPQKNE